MTARTRMDAAYGRRGGHIIPGKPQHLDRSRQCTVCGSPILTVGSNGMHFVCDPSSTVGRPGA